MLTLTFRKNLTVLFLTLFVSLSASAACENERCKGFQADFDYFVQKGVENYCYWHEKEKDTGHNYKTLAEELRSKISDDTDITQLDTIMRTWASAFHDGHVNFMLTASGEPIQLASADVRFELLAAGTEEETLIIAKSTAALGLSPGNIVTHVGKHTAKEAIDLAVSTQSGSTLRMRRFAAARRLIEVIARVDQEESEIPILIHDAQSPRDAQTILVPFKMVAYPGPAGASTAFDPPVRSMILDHNIGYLRISRFIDSESLIFEAMNRLADTDALIIDVRSNGGGDQSADEVLGRLIQKEITRYSVSARASADVLKERFEFQGVPLIEGTQYTQWIARLVSPTSEVPYLNKKVVTLIDSGCFSACDTFVSALKQNGLSTIIGVGTGGGTGTPMVQKLPYTKHSFRYSVIRGQTVDGQLLEGAGTLPDILSQATAEERAMGIDSTLSRAVNHLVGPRNDLMLIGLTTYPHHEVQSLEVDPRTFEQMHLGIDCNDLMQ